MKKSALKEAIKNEIRSVLSENQMTTDEAFRILRDIEDILPGRVTPSNIQLMGQALDHLQAGEITRMMSDEERESKLQQAMRGGGKEEPLRKLAAIGKELNEGTWGTGTYNEISRFINDIRMLKNDYYDIVGSDDVFNGLDQAESAAEEMIINAPENRSDITEDEEPTSAELKKKDSVTSAANKLQKLVKKMKDKAKEFKAAEGEAKDKIKDELKKMTAEKKELEKSL